MVALKDHPGIAERFHTDKAFYDTIKAARRDYELTERFTILPFSGRGFVVPQGHTFRVIQAAGPQITDATFWNAHNPKEHFSSMRTRSIEDGGIRGEISVLTRLWSEVPYLRPMATCVDDTVVTNPNVPAYSHHFVGEHCCSEEWEMFYGRKGLNSCHVNFLQAIEPFGLKEENLRSNIALHEKDYLDPSAGLNYMLYGDGKPGDYVEFYSEMDLLVAVSVCPSGDGEQLYPEVSSVDVSESDKKGYVRPLTIEVYNTGIKPKPFPAWTSASK